MGDAATAAALAEGDADAQALMGEVTVAKALDSVRAGQVDLAVAELTRFRDANPNLAEARVGLAKALIAKRDAAGAAAELQKAIELAPESAEAHYQMGYVSHVMKRDAAAALPHYEKAVAADPANVEYRTNLGAALADVKQTDRAVAELTKVVESPGYARADAWIYLGGAHLAAKKYKDAIAALKKADERAPDNVQTHTYLAWSYFGLKDADNFKKHAAKAKALGQKEPTLLQYLSRVEAGEAIK
jgi:tetratricopeptide (TPR) repeat protein